MAHPDSWQTISGQTMDLELGYLQRLITTLPDSVAIVELGVCQGRSLCALALACQGSAKVVYGVDDFNSSNPGYVTPSLEETQANVTRLELWPWISLMATQDSTQAGVNWVGRDVWLLFHDASHYYDKVKADLEAWLPHIVEGGYICLHDYTGESADQVGVSQAGNELLGKPIDVQPRLGVFRWTGKANV